MQMIKRFAFWPLLALVCGVIASGLSNHDHGTTWGFVLGVGLSIPVALMIDRRRQHRSDRYAMQVLGRWIADRVRPGRKRTTSPRA